jgi:hypothetical protein
MIMFLHKVCVLVLLLCTTVLVEAAFEQVPQDVVEDVAPYTSAFRDTLKYVQEHGNACCIPEYDDPNILVGVDAVRMLTPEMLTVTYSMYQQARHDRSFLEHLWSILLLDADKGYGKTVVQAEFGGLGVRNDHLFEILHIPSNGRYALTDRHVAPGEGTYASGKWYHNQTYTLPKWSWQSIHYTLMWHAHAGQCEPCHPSFSDIGYGSDILAAKQHTKMDGVTHQFLFANCRNTLSIVYFGGVMKDDEPVIAVVALPYIHVEQY